MRKLRKIRLHQEGTHQLTVGFFVWLFVNAAAYYLTYPELRWLFILIAVFTTTLYLLLVNFFRCPPRRFPGEDTEGIAGEQHGKREHQRGEKTDSLFHDYLL